jgi:hypothetical protein
MPRLPRIDAPGVIHHVIIRGIEKRAIFQDQSDYEDFLKRLEALIPETQTRCYACGCGNAKLTHPKRPLQVIGDALIL